MRPSGTILASTVSDPQAHWRMFVGAKFKCPLFQQSLSVRFAGSLGGSRGSVRKVVGQPKRTHGSAWGQSYSESVALVTDHGHGTVPAGAVPSVAVVPLTSGLAHA